jgi:hypothetical protein
MIVFFRGEGHTAGKQRSNYDLVGVCLFCPIEDFQVGKSKGASAVKLLRPLLIEP